MWGGSPLGILLHCDLDRQGALGVHKIANRTREGTIAQDSKIPNSALISKVASSFGNSREI